MSKRLAVVLVVVWLLSLAGVAVLTAQVMPHPVMPTVMSGADVGFRVEAIDPKDGAAIGRIVLYVNGKWVEARIGGFATGPKLTP